MVRMGRRHYRQADESADPTRHATSAIRRSESPAARCARRPAGDALLDHDAPQRRAQALLHHRHVLAGVIVDIEPGLRSVRIQDAHDDHRRTLISRYHARTRFRWGTRRAAQNEKNAPTFPFLLWLLVPSWASAW